MQAARRMYLYVMSGITLGVIAVGLATLLGVVIAGSGILEHPYGGLNPRQELSQAIAMLGVGLPVWAAHWWIVQRGLRAARPDRDAERGSPIRAAFLTIVLLVTLLIWVTSASSVLLAVVVGRVPTLEPYAYGDPVSSAAWTIVGLTVWLYHGVVRRGDLGAGPVTGAAAWIPRLYLYGVSVGSLFTALASLGPVVRYAVGSAAGADPYLGDDRYLLLQATQSGIAVLAWGLVWFAHWQYAAGLVRSDGWRGVAERESRTRVAAFVVTIMTTAAMSLVFLALAVNELATPLVAERPGGETPIRPIAAAFLVALPWVVAWWAHLRGFRREPIATDPLRALHQERLVSHGVAAVALAVGATGAGWVVGLVIDAALGGDRTAGGFPGTWATELSFWLPAAALGLIVWATHWRRVLSRRRIDPAAEAGSVISRAFTYVTLAGALIVALGTAALILYRLVSTVLGQALGGPAVSELSTPLGVLLAAVVVLGYHGLGLRSDLARTSSPDDEPAAVAAVGSVGSPGAPAGPPARRRFVLVGPSEADLDAAVAAARTALPPGVELSEAPVEA